LLFSANLSTAAPRTEGTLRWAAGAPNCTLRVSDDGHVYYGLTHGNFALTLGIDRQELEKIQHRAIPVIGVFFSARYSGSGTLDIPQARFALEFVRHRRVVQPALEPGQLLRDLQNMMDAVTDEIERHQISKHPDEKESKEKELQVRLRDYTEMMDFISTRALQSSTLDGAHPSSAGWVFFSTKNPWIGSWHRPEKFVLRMPIENLTVEFPFELPPKAGPVALRRRAAD
jgi:hypothetical protein